MKKVLIIMVLIALVGVNATVASAEDVANTVVPLSHGVDH